MDFIFGTLATDELKLVHHRATRQGLQHNHQLTPTDPLPDQPVTLTVMVGPNISPEQVVCYYTHDGSEPLGERGHAQNGHVLSFEPGETVWDTLVWGYLTRWKITLPAQPEGTFVRYRIGAWTQNGEEVFADWPHAQDTAERAAAAFFRKEAITPELLYTPPSHPHTFTYHVDHFAPPQWARDAVIYQIFVDRFYPGDGKEWLQTDDLSGFCGGTLWGVCDKLDYIADLGANCIWLSPIFVSPSHHGYDALEYKRVETRLGGDEALRALIEAAHKRGIRVMLDLACNHLSNEHQIFQSAITDPKSPYRSWFTFDDSDVGYRSFFGVASLPQLNLAHAETRAWMIDIARFWLREFDVDGFRLDYANGPGPDFWSDFWEACKSEKADSFCFGEVIDAPNEQRAYIGRLDGCLDFHLGEALRKTYGWRTQTEADFDRFLSRHQPYFPQNFLLPTFLDNHDMDRFLYIAKGDKAALKQAAAAQMRLSGPPIIYYGTEVGLNQSVGVADGKGLEVSRVPMLWGEEQDQELLDFYKQIIRERRK